VKLADLGLNRCKASRATQLAAVPTLR